MWRTIGYVAAAMCLLACCGCGRKSHTIVTPEGEKVTITEQGSKGQLTVEGPQGEKVQFAGDKGSLKLPEGFPTDVPVYPKSRVVATATEKQAVTVSLETSDTVDEVAKFYADKLKAAGWQIATTFNTEENSVVSATKQKRTCTVAAGRRDKGTMLTLMVSSDKD